MRPFVVAIDGPAGVGKSTAARELARQLGVPYLDTGAMYRALALKVLASGLSADDRAGVETLAATVDLRVEAAESTGSLLILLDGEPVGARIRAPEVSAATSVIAAYPAVRRRLVEVQRVAGERWGGVVEGRDIGTRVFPDAAFKFFFDARPEVRARRRYDELVRAGREVSLAQVVAEMEVRDRRDSGREHSPLTLDDSYVLVDTSDRSLEQVVAQMRRVVEAGSDGAGSTGAGSGGAGTNDPRLA